MNFSQLFDKEFSVQATHLIGLVFVLGLAIGFSSGMTASDWSNPDNEPNTVKTNDNEDSAPSTVEIAKIQTGEQPKLGSDDAPVKMVIYEDFQCPFCQRFENGAMTQVIDNYVQSGKVQIIWKDFPLQRIHPWATGAAETMECVYREDNQAFWEVKKKIFDNQDSVSRDNVEQRIIDWAADEGVSNSTIRSCLQNGAPEEAVKADMREATSFDAKVGGDSFVSGTPSVVIYRDGDKRGEPLVGAQPYSAVKQVIESELGQ